MRVLGKMELSLLSTCTAKSAAFAQHSEPRNPSSPVDVWQQSDVERKSADWTGAWLGLP